MKCINAALKVRYLALQATKTIHFISVSTFIDIDITSVETTRTLGDFAYGIRHAIFPLRAVAWVAEICRLSCASNHDQWQCHTNC